MLLEVFVEVWSSHNTAHPVQVDTVHVPVLKHYSSRQGLAKG
jgi:hypothetical protein